MKKQPHSLSGRLWSGQPDPLARALGILVWPLGGLYGRLAALRAWAYSREIKASQTAGLPVISLGNLTVGGTGKTPFVLHLGRRLMERGFEPAVVLRGYGGRAGTGPVQVRPGMKAGDVGDEALMLAELSGLTVIAGSDRKAGAELAGQVGAALPPLRGE